MNKAENTNSIPKGWTILKIGRFFSKNISGDWGSDAQFGLPYSLVVGTPNFNNDGTIDWGTVKERHLTKVKLTPRKICYGNILVEKSGGSDDWPAGRVVWCDKSVEGTCSNFVQLLEVITEYDSKFIFYLLFYYYMKGRIYPYQQKTTGIINFKINKYLEEAAVIPSSSDEQSKIAEILSTIDEAINKTDKLIEKYKRIKKGLMRDLFRYGIGENGQIRSEKTHKFKDSPLGRIPVEWDVRAIYQVAQPKSIKNISHRLFPVLSCTKYRGLVDSLEYFQGRRIFSDDLQSYKLVRKGWFAYATNHIEEGSIGFQDIYECALVSPMYTVFEPLDTVDPAWLYTLLKSDGYIDIYKLETMATVNRRGSLRWNMFSQILLALPPKQEQIAISFQLSKITELIEKEKLYSEKLLALKQGLMEDLLSGKVRVNHLIQCAG